MDMLYQLLALNQLFVYQWSVVFVFHLRLTDNRMSRVPYQEGSDLALKYLTSNRQILEKYLQTTNTLAYFRHRRKKKFYYILHNILKRTFHLVRDQTFRQKCPKSAQIALKICSKWPQKAPN
jgi:hypothetical protein